MKRTFSILLTTLVLALPALAATGAKPDEEGSGQNPAQADDILMDE